jgi:P-type conjugative transfer protein TrbJ
MSTPCSTRLPTCRSRPNRAAAAVALILVGATACSDPKPAQAQQIVFDPKSYAESALHTAHQLESLSNEARMLANQARQLAASPYSHLAETSQTLRDIGDLARSIRGIAANTTQLESQFEQLYPTAVRGLDPRQALQQAQARNINARDTAQDLARAAAELERLSQSRTDRLQGAVSASERATGQTAAIQSSTQVLAVLAEDLGSMRTILLAQSRLMAEESARESAERAASAEARRQFWGHDAGPPSNPNFDPLPHARN